VLEAVEADLRERGLPVPPRPISHELKWGIALAIALLLALVIAVIS